MSRPIDVALIYPPWAVLDGRAILQNSLRPLGILSIASHLESLDHTVKSTISTAGGRMTMTRDELTNRFSLGNPAVTSIRTLAELITRLVGWH